LKGYNYFAINIVYPRMANIVIIGLGSGGLQLHWLFEGLTLKLS